MAVKKQKEKKLFKTYRLTPEFYFDRVHFIRYTPRLLLYSRPCREIRMKPGMARRMKFIIVRHKISARCLGRSHQDTSSKWRDCRSRSPNKRRRRRRRTTGGPGLGPWSPRRMHNTWITQSHDSRSVSPSFASILRTSYNDIFCL